MFHYSISAVVNVLRSKETQSPVYPFIIYYKITHMKMSRSTFRVVVHWTIREILSHAVRFQVSRVRPQVIQRGSRARCKHLEKASSADMKMTNMESTVGKLNYGAQSFGFHTVLWLSFNFCFPVPFAEEVRAAGRRGGTSLYSLLYAATENCMHASTQYSSLDTRERLACHLKPCRYAGRGLNVATS